jgi:hypothetical protein
LLEMRRTTHGEWRVSVRCCWCERPCSDPSGWQVVFDGRVEPAMCCGPQCAQGVRDDDPTRTWTSVPLGQFLVDLTAQFADNRTSLRCVVCRHPERSQIDTALLQHSVTQREVAGMYGFAKGSVYNHHVAHLPVAAALASRATRAARYTPQPVGRM